MNDRVAAAITQLEHSKADGLSFADAKQALLRQGFTEAEINLAASQFAYTDPAQPPTHDSPLLSTGADQAIANQEVHDMTVGQADDVAVGRRVFERDQRVRTYTLVLIVPLAVAAPFFLMTLAGVLQAPSQYARALSSLSLEAAAGITLVFWVIWAYVLLLAFGALLFRAKNEALITKVTLGMAIGTILIFLVLAIIARSPVLLLGLLAVLPEVLISRRLGLLSKFR